MRCIFWWEWLDSNQLRLKPTDLQSAPALQLRRTPNPLVRAAGIEPAFQAWKACILAFVLCPQQIQSHLIIYQIKTKSSPYFKYSPTPQIKEIKYNGLYTNNPGTRHIVYRDFFTSNLLFLIYFFIGGKQSPSPFFGQHANTVFPISLKTSSPQQPNLFG